MQVEITIPATIDETFHYIAVALYATRESTTDIGNYVDYTNIQLEQSSTATSYEPYVGGIPSPNSDYPQEVNRVTGNVNIKIENENLGYIELEGKFRAVSQNGDIQTNADFNSYKAEVKESTQYKVKSFLL